MESYNLVILGQGSAAFAAAIKADELGVKTAMVGSSVTKGTVVGGTCVNVGCIPSKRLITVGTTYYEGTERRPKVIGYGRGRVDFPKVVREKDALVRSFRKRKYADVLKGLKNVTYYPDQGRFVSKNEVKVGENDGAVLQADRFLIAAGARASIPSIEGIDKIDYLTNEEALSLKELPRSLCVIGGRALGLEFAQMYAQFGSKVTVLQRSESILPEDEPEISSALTKYLQQIGVEVYTGVEINKVSRKGMRNSIELTSSDVPREVVCDQILFATGRTPNTEHLDLPRAGVKTDSRGFVQVDEGMRTSVPNIWAAGDVTGEPMLETLAAKEGSIAVHNAFNGDQDKKKTINLDEIPSAVFTYPEVARVGLTEAGAHKKGVKCSCRVLPLDLVPKARVIGDTRGLVKMVIDSQTKRVLGVHILAPHAADLIHEGVLAVKNKLTIDDIIDTVHVFPTLSESVKLAAQSFYMDVSKMSCCVE